MNLSSDSCHLLHRARQNHRPELQSTSHEIQTRHSNISLDRGTGSDLVLVLQKMFHYMMRYKIYLLLYYRITCIQKLSHIVKIKRGQRKCSGGVWFRSVPDDAESEHLVHLVEPVTVIPRSHTSLTSDFSWLFFFFCLLFLSYRSSDQLNIYFRSQKSHWADLQH